MKKLQQKIKKTQLLVKTRKIKLQEEASKLNEIRSEKLAALQELSSYQSKYIEGVEILNTERQSTQRNKLAALESSLTYTKSQWYKSLSKVRELEQKEKVQLKELVEAQSNVKVLEILIENDHRSLKKFINQEEQKMSDEMATQRFAKRS